MVSFIQVVFSLLGLGLPIYDLPETSHTKNVAIVGAGSAGLAMLKSLSELQETYNLNIVLFEERHSLGGVWLPDASPAPPPRIPETPLYPLLHTNTPVPSMSYPGFPFPKGTYLYPSHEEIQAYHERYANHYNITSFIRFRHKVLKSLWRGDADAGFWDVTYRDMSGRTRHEHFDHLIVATGNNHLPRIPTWPGQEEWLSNDPSFGFRREILHSVWYRGPQKYKGLRVLIVGTGSSGRDIALQITPVAKQTFVSARHVPDPIVGPIPAGAIPKPDISHFTANGVVFTDGSILDVDAVLLATGYEILKPFLENGGTLITDREARSSHSGQLVTNTRYIFPLHQHIFSLTPSYPTNALAFIGLPSAIANCPSDIAQSLFVAQAILNSSLLPPRDELLKQLAAHEDNLRSAGYDPYSIGHKLPTNTSSDYQDELVDFLKVHGAIPDDGKKFVEPWRRDILNYRYLREGWKRIERLGTQKEWLEGVETEAQWSDIMNRINRWQEDWETVQGIPFRQDWDMLGDLNRLIMDYLVIEGYKAAAEEFSQEADIAPPVDFESIESRMNIREALQRGDIEDAITRVNDLNPEGRITEALEFAQTELAPRGEESPEFLSELERTMALLAFECGSAPGSIAELMSPSQRMKTAGEVNGAILESLSQGKEVKLGGVLKLLGWGEELLSDKTEYPKMA
ncbi:hypothetical protein H0H92_007017 [Tricholoma furcatifolium]|nr:hypothetical protein H0H92_007017 [Tricholoma furcatifolium]